MHTNVLGSGKERDKGDDHPCEPHVCELREEPLGVLVQLSGEPAPIAQVRNDEQEAVDDERDHQRHRGDRERRAVLQLAVQKHAPEPRVLFLARAVRCLGRGKLSERNKRDAGNQERDVRQIMKYCELGEFAQSYLNRAHGSGLNARGEHLGAVDSIVVGTVKRGVAEVVVKKAPVLGRARSRHLLTIVLNIKMSFASAGFKENKEDCEKKIGSDPSLGVEKKKKKKKQPIPYGCPSLCNIKRGHEDPARPRRVHVPEPAREQMRQVRIGAAKEIATEAKGRTHLAHGAFAKVLGKKKGGFHFHGQVSITDRIQKSYLAVVLAVGAHVAAIASADAVEIIAVAVARARWVHNARPADVGTIRFWDY